MTQPPSSAYHLLVYRDGAPTPLAVAIEEVWSGDARPEEFAVTLEPGPVPQGMAVPTDTRSNEMEPDTVSSSPLIEPQAEVR